MPYEITVLPATWQKKIPPLHQVKAGTRFSDPGGMQGRVNLCYVKTDQLEIEPATCQSQVQRPTAVPPGLKNRTLLLGISGAGFYGLYCQSTNIQRAELKALTSTTENHLLALSRRDITQDSFHFLILLNKLMPLAVAN